MACTSGDRRLILGTERTDHEIDELMHEAKSGLVAHLEAFAGNTIEFIRSESPLLIDGIGIPDIDVDLRRRHVVVVAEEPSAADDLKALKPFIKEYQPVLIGVGTGADVLRKAGYRPQLIVGDPEQDQHRDAASAAPRWCCPPTPTATRRAWSGSRISVSGR